MKLVKKLECRCCGKIFYLCRKCYRGHVYCSATCRRAGYLERRRIAQQKYQKTAKGKRMRNKSANRRRNGEKKYTGMFRTIMQTCICLMMLFMPKREHKENESFEKCSVCGMEGNVVEDFPRRKYKEKNEEICEINNNELKKLAT